MSTRCFEELGKAVADFGIIYSTENTRADTDRWSLGVTNQKMTSALEIHGSAIRFEFAKKKPNQWWRFWQWVLLGWQWIDL